MENKILYNKYDEHFEEVFVIVTVLSVNCG